MRRHEEWTIAYRKRDNDVLLIDNQDAVFTCIGNTWRYWCADPHLYERNGQTYIFAELYDRILRRGVIGCCELTDSGCSKWNIVLRQPYHLSYPHVFEDHGDVYMIPESYEASEIAVFKAISFPNKWQKVHVLKERCVAVDSTLFTDNHNHFMLTLESEGNDEYFRMYQFTEGGMPKHPHLISCNSSQVRPAGNLFFHNRRLLRPAQDCSDSYGCALNFYHVTKIEETAYTEELTAKITPSMIRSDLIHEQKGIHTYNVTDQYEVIDLKYEAIDLLFYVMRPIWYLWRRIKKIWRG